MPRLRLSSVRVLTGGLTVSALLLSGIGPAHADAGDWSQYRATPTNNTHVVTGGAQIFSGTIPTANEVRATPVVADGKVFVGSHGSGELQAFDLATGELLWQAQAPNWVHS